MLRWLGEKEEWVDQTLKEGNIKLFSNYISYNVLQGLKNYADIYSRVNRYTSGQSVVMMWVHKQISVETDYYKFWNDRIIETRLKIQRGYLTVLVVYVRVVNSWMLFDAYIMFVIF